MLFKHFAIVFLLLGLSGCLGSSGEGQNPSPNPQSPTNPEDENPDQNSEMLFGRGRVYVENSEGKILLDKKIDNEKKEVTLRCIHEYQSETQIYRALHLITDLRKSAGSVIDKRVEITFEEVKNKDGEQKFRLDSRDGGYTGYYRTGKYAETEGYNVNVWALPYKCRMDYNQKGISIFGLAQCEFADSAFGDSSVTEIEFECELQKNQK